MKQQLALACAVSIQKHIVTQHKKCYHHVYRHSLQNITLLDAKRVHTLFSNKM